MFGRPIDLFTLFGFRVRLDASWFILAVLVTWTLAAGLFPNVYEGLSTTTYWVMGVLGALGLFVSIVVHEFFHALVARRNAIPMRGITLFIFGGVAEMDAEPPSARAELLMAGAGPLASVLIGVGALALGALLGDVLPVPVAGVIGYLGSINLLLAAFNLIPAFPLDGGRILRAGLWHWKRDLRRATRIASRIGSGFGLALILLGVLRVIGAGDFIGGMWWFLIGMFLRGAANASYQQVLLRQALEGEPVRRFMKPDPVAVPATLPVGEFVEDYVYRHHHKLFPVVENGQLTGCVTTQQVKAVPREEWQTRHVRDIATSCVPDNTVTPDMDALEALARMRRTGASRLLVAEGERLIGILTLKDLLEFFALKVDLER